MNRYNELVAYYDTNGHCNVPRGYEANPQLGHWVHEQRNRYKKGKLEGNRIAMLNELGFQWNPHNKRWIDNYNELVAYHAEHGDCNVQKKYEVNNIKLGIWADSQRKQYKKGKLNADSIAMLENLGFQWSPKEERWMAYYSELVAYHDEN
jgi:hypothetical protein